MNFVDLILFFTIGVFMLIGMYKGCVRSAFRVVSFLVSWIGAFIIYPLFAKLLFLNDSFVKSFRFYAEGTEKLADLEMASVKVATLSQDQIAKIVNDSVSKAQGGLRSPLNSAVMKNMQNLAFEGKFETVGEYFNETIVQYGVNIICFIIAFFIIKIIVNIILNVYENSNEIPTLNQYDVLAGGILGIIEGVFILFVIFSIVPLIMNIMAIKPIEDMLSSSLLGNLFVRGNLIPRMIRSVV